MEGGVEESEGGGGGSGREGGVERREEGESRFGMASQFTFSFSKTGRCKKY